MKIATKLPAAFLMMTAPLAAYAQGGAPHILLYSFGGGLVGGFIGALLACLICKKRHAGKDQTDLKKY